MCNQELCCGRVRLEMLSRQLDIRVQVGTGKLIWESLGNSHDIGCDHLVQLGKRR